MSTALRRTKRHLTPPPPPTPKILYMPRSRRTRRKQANHRHYNNPLVLLMHHKYQSDRGKLQNLFHKENNNASPTNHIGAAPLEFLNSKSKSPAIERRERVEENDHCGEYFNGSGCGSEEEKWRFQSEILRAECKLLRMEREFALKKLEEKRVNIDLSITANTSSVASSANSTSKRILCPAPAASSNPSTTQFYKEEEPMILVHENKCSGSCKAILRRIVEQVRAETEQWSQMQEMLAQVRAEMEDLHASRDFWENRAYNADHQIRSLTHVVEEWKAKAVGYENKVNELQLELSVLKEEAQKSKSDLHLVLLPPVPLGKQLEKEKVVSSFRLKKNRHIDDEEEEEEEEGPYKSDQNGNLDLELKDLKIEEEEEKRTPKKDSPPLSLGKQLAKEKRMLLRRLKGYRHDGGIGSKQELSESPADGRRKLSYSTSFGILPPNRSPLMDIGNSSPLTRQSSTRSSAFCFHSPESSRIRDSFRRVYSIGISKEF